MGHRLDTDTSIFPVAGRVYVGSIWAADTKLRRPAVASPSFSLPQTLSSYCTTVVTILQPQDNITMINTPKRTRQETTSVCPPPPRRATVGARPSPSVASSLASSFTSTTSLESILANVDLVESSTTKDLNRFSFTSLHSPAFPSLSEDDVNQDGPAKLIPRRSRRSTM